MGEAVSVRNESRNRNVRPGKFVKAAICVAAVATRFLGGDAAQSDAAPINGLAHKVVCPEPTAADPKVGLELVNYRPTPMEVAVESTSATGNVRFVLERILQSGDVVKPETPLKAVEDGFFRVGVSGEAGGESEVTQIPVNCVEDEPDPVTTTTNVTTTTTMPATTTTTSTIATITTTTGLVGTTTTTKVAPVTNTTVTIIGQEPGMINPGGNVDEFIIPDALNGDVSAEQGGLASRIVVGLLDRTG